MASQQALLMDTIWAMKKAMKRKAYESDSDDEVNYRGNRGQKLKKRARFVHEGQLAPPSGPDAYREIVEHGGYQRAIISRNPPAIDDEGYEPESDDADYEERMQAIADTSAELNPYASVRLENILAPLTAVTDLPAHPTLSRSYTSKTLTDLTQQACDIMHKENAALWKVKHLHTKLVGDHVWVPCEVMETPNDLNLYQPGYNVNGSGETSVSPDTNMLLLEQGPAEGSLTSQASVTGQAPTANNPPPTRAEAVAGDVDIPMADLDAPTNGGATGDSDAVNSSDEDKAAAKSAKAGALNGTKIEEEYRKPEIAAANSGAGPTANGPGKLTSQNGESSIHLLQRAATSNGANPPGSVQLSALSLDAMDELDIHPLFLAPRSAQPNRDVGIPEAEAEDLRRLLQLFVQKQEEVCRGAKQLYEGLLRADRLRKTVFQWSKYEAHVGLNRDMSDGEDWYDKEEWGLDDDLKKGQDEEEEDTMQTTKKTRTRR